MRVLSVASGVGTDALAWAPLGWTHVAFAEIGAFPSAVLAHRFPEIPNLGDFTKITERDVGAIDLLVGGTPCQDFSISGLRAGLDGANGVLALEYLRLVGRLRPRWVVWENVRGVLSANGGGAFGSFLGGLAELGYGFAYRVLDAQYFGLAQRRERVFIVGHSGGTWQRAAAVLFERAGLRGDPPPRRETWSEVAGPLTTGSSGGSGWRVGGDEAAAGHIVAHALTRSYDASEDGSGRGLPLVAHALTTRPGRKHDTSTDTFVADTLGVRERGDTADRNVVVGVIPFDTTQVTSSENRSRCEPGAPAPALSRSGHAPAIAFHQIQDPISGEVSPALGNKTLGMGVLVASAVRRLTPRECERLMGYPDDHTLVPYGKKRMPAKDGPRYAAIGNGIAEPVLAWIGRQIAAVDALERAHQGRMTKDPNEHGEPCEAR